VVFNDLPWTSADARQAEDRAHRMGQLGTVDVYWMKAMNNIFDSALTATVLRKLNLHMRIQNGERLTAEERAFADAAVSMSEIVEAMRQEIKQNVKQRGVG